MSEFFTPVNALLMLGSLQGIILALILTFKKKGNKTANRILAGILFFISFAIVFHSLSHARILPFLSTHTIIIGIASLLISPLLYFYVKALTSYHFKFSGRDIRHLIPFAVCTLLGLIFLFSQLDINKYGFTETGLFHETILIISLLVYSFYIILANIRLLAYSKSIKDNFSNVERINLIWLRILFLLLTLFFVFAVVLDLFLSIKNWDYIWLGSCIIIYFISYFGLVQPVIFSGPSIAAGILAGGKNRKYLRSSLNGEKAEKYLQNLRSVMTEKSIYLDRDMSLSKLADELGISIHHLSQIINEKLATNFYNFINSYRIKEAENRLKDPGNSHLSIASIGFDVGFHSLSAFNAAFKKITGVTPSHYRSRHLSP